MAEEREAGFQVGYRPSDGAFCFFSGGCETAWVRRDLWGTFVDWLAGDPEAASCGPMTVMRWPMADNCRVLMCLGVPPSRDAALVFAADLDDWAVIVAQLRAFGERMEQVLAEGGRQAKAARPTSAPWGWPAQRGLTLGFSWS